MPDKEVDGDMRTKETVRENAALVNVRGFMIVIRVFKVLCGLSALFVGAMAVSMLIAIGTVGDKIPLEIRMSIGFGQAFNVIFSLIIILALLGVNLLLRYLRFLKYWAGLGVFMVYTGFQLYSYTQTSLGLVSAADTSKDGILADTDALETAADVAAFMLMAVGGVFFFLALMCLQRLETAPTVGVTRTTTKDYGEGTRNDMIELDTTLLETERRIPTTVDL